MTQNLDLQIEVADLRLRELHAVTFLLEPELGPRCSAPRRRRCARLWHTRLGRRRCPAVHGGLDPLATRGAVRVARAPRRRARHRGPIASGARHCGREWYQGGLQPARGDPVQGRLYAVRVHP